MSDRYYVSLTATCTNTSLPDVLDRMQAAQTSLATTDVPLDGLSLSFTREDGVELIASDGSLPTALPMPGPVVSTGPGTPPPDAVDMPVVEPEPDTRDPSADTGQHTDPEQLG